jgi:hypothetical protein
MADEGVDGLVIVRWKIYIFMYLCISNKKCISLRFDDDVEQYDDEEPLEDVDDLEVF